MFLCMYSVNKICTCTGLYIRVHTHIYRPVYDIMSVFYFNLARLKSNSSGWSDHYYFYQFRALNSTVYLLRMRIVDNEQEATSIFVAMMTCHLT